MIGEPLTFGGYRKEDSKYKVLGFPLEVTTTFREGTKWGPYEIRRASTYIEFRSSLTGLDVDEIGFHDLGDVAPVLGDLKESLKAFERVLRDVEGIPIILGGEHSLTYAAVKALRPECLLILDAHLDLRDECMGQKWSHATWLRRLSEEIELRVIVAGARAYVKEEVEYAKKKGIKIITEPPLVPENVSPCKSLYLSLDMDFFDPAVAPGVSNPEPGGYSFSDYLTILQSLYKTRLVGMDVVELSPPYDPSGVTATLAARAIIEAVAANEL